MGITTTISKELEWFRPYLEAAQSLVPIERLTMIRALYPSLKSINRFTAQITKQGEAYYLCLYVTIYKLDKLPSERVLSRYTKMDLLCSLAHELSHMTHWNHTTDHKRLEAKLTLLFMDVLDSEGYIDEEHEYQNPPFK